LLLWLPWPFPLAARKKNPSLPLRLPLLKLPLLRPLPLPPPLKLLLPLLPRLKALLLPLLPPPLKLLPLPPRRSNLAVAQ
jgi:hypothetical protein